MNFLKNIFKRKKLKVDDEDLTWQRQNVNNNNNLGVKEVPYNPDYYQPEEDEYDFENKIPKGLMNENFTEDHERMMNTGLGNSSFKITEAYDSNLQGQKNRFHNFKKKKHSVSNKYLDSNKIYDEIVTNEDRPKGLIPIDYKQNIYSSNINSNRLFTDHSNVMP